MRPRPLRGGPARCSPLSAVRTQSGLAIAAAVMVLALLLAATAGTLWLTQSELWAAGRTRALVQARYSAESGVQHALASLAPGTSFAALVAGTGGLARPAAPGPLPLAGGWVSFPGPPFGYGVTPVAVSGGGVNGERVLLRAVGTSVGGATRWVIGSVGRAQSPYAPAALVIADGTLAIEPAVGGGISIDARGPAGGSQAVIGAASLDSAAAASAALRASGAATLGAVQGAVADPIDFAAYRAATALPVVDPGGVGGPIGSAGQPAALALGRGSLAGLTGVGALLAIDDLEVAGALAWQGVLLVAGELRLTAAPCQVSGMVWARTVRFSAACAIQYDADAITAADGALRLPRKAVLLALTDG